MFLSLSYSMVVLAALLGGIVIMMAVVPNVITITEMGQPGCVDKEDSQTA